MSRFVICIFAAGLLLGGCGGMQPTFGTPVSQAMPAGGSASKYLSHVIVIVQENRSFENFFAGYPGANAPLTGCASPLPGDPARPHVNSSSSCPGKDTQVTLHQDTFKNNPDLKHSWGPSMVDWNNGQMDGFSKFGIKNGKYEAYDFIEHSEIEPYWTMANQYVLADAMFPTEFGGSFTAHLTLVAGTDDIKLPNEAEVNFPSATPDDCDSPPGTRSAYLTPNRVVHYNGPFPVLVSSIRSRRCSTARAPPGNTTRRSVKTLGSGSRSRRSNTYATAPTGGRTTSSVRNASAEGRV